MAKNFCQLLINTGEPVRQEATSQIAIAATLSVRGNPTLECTDGNARAVCPQNNAEQSESPKFGSTAGIKRYVERLNTSFTFLEI